MTVLAWPAGLPQYVLTDGYGSGPPNTALRSSVDVGPAKVRRRSSSAPYPIKAKVMVTSVQLNDIFLPFYNDDLLGGTLRFEWVDPIDRESTVEMRFTEAPSWSAVGHDFFDLVMVLEVLP